MTCDRDISLGETYRRSERIESHGFEWGRMSELVIEIVVMSQITLASVSFLLANNYGTLPLNNAVSVSVAIW